MDNAWIPLSTTINQRSHYRGKSHNSPKDEVFERKLTETYPYTGFQSLCIMRYEQMVYRITIVILNPETSILVSAQPYLIRCHHYNMDQADTLLYLRHVRCILCLHVVKCTTGIRHSSLHYGFYSIVIC